jgi:hypothetical protein
VDTILCGTSAPAAAALADTFYILLYTVCVYPCQMFSNNDEKYKCHKICSPPFSLSMNLTVLYLGSLINGLEPFRIWLRMRRDIHIKSLLNIPFKEKGYSQRQF